MDLLADHVFLSRLQFALTTMFHIAWPLLSIGLAVFLLYLEIMWLKTKDVAYYRHFRFWTKLFLLNFAIGVVTGIPLEFEFGTNFGPFSRSVGNFFGQVLSFEGTTAFMLESAFLWIMAFGWKRVSAGMHLFATCMVTLGTGLSAFWIMAANSWMQSPSGGHMENGQFIMDSFLGALFSPDLPYGFSHMYAACLETTIFVVGGVSAWYILKGRHVDFFLRSFKAAFVAAILITPLQAYLGDGSGVEIAVLQPAKVAAVESHWETNPPGEGASWNMVAWPDPENEKNAFQIQVPYFLSLLITHSFTGQVKGLKDFPEEDRPPILIPFYAFRGMAGIGFLMIGLMLWTAWAWKKGKLAATAIAAQKKLLMAWMLMAPLGYLAVEMGWATREVGRQPWMAYGLVRTADGAAKLPAATVAFSLIALAVIYALLGALFAFFAWRILKKGPDLTLEPETPRKEQAPAHARGAKKTVKKGGSK